jgi:tetrahydromethanopterin S-methyltransferase subunit G
MATEVEKELRDLKRRVDLAETRLSQLEGRFEFVSGQLRDIQLYMHARFDDVETRFDEVNARFDKVDAKVDGLRSDMPDIVATAVSAVLREQS